jgi:hypothetical protein
VKSRVPFAALAVLAPLSTLTACGSAQGSAPPSQSAAAAAAVGPVATPASSPPSSPSGAVTACGTEAAETLARTAGAVAKRIYAKELAGTEVSNDMHQVEGYGPLLSALESGNRAATKEAVTSLVYSHTHVVRLRVTRGNAVLADVGGPQILAPVKGTLRHNGTTLGHYVLSVQDDLGYVKLVSRFIGAPLVLTGSSGALAIEGAVSPGPAAIPTHGPVSYHGHSYQAFSFPAQAFPSGALRISLLMPVSASLSSQSCATIKVAELGDVAQRVSRRFVLSGSTFGSYIKTTTSLTGGLIYIKSGSRQLAGSSRPAPNLPAQGTVRSHGVTYGVSSFTAPSEAGQVRIYQLVRE